MKTKTLGSSNVDADSLKMNEKFFENCIDLIPARIYLNADDRKQWFKLLNKEVGNEADDEEDDGDSSNDEDEADDAAKAGQIKHSRFDSLYYKTVSELYKELEKCKKLNRPVNFQNVKKIQHQKSARGDDENEESRKRIKMENKNQSSGSGGGDKDSKPKDGSSKKISKSKQDKIEKRKREKNNELTQSSGDEKAKATPAAQNKKPILNQNGQIVYSKFDFSVDGSTTNQNGAKSKGSKKQSKLNANVKPKDYKVLVKKLQEKKEKLTKLKETEPDKAFELETNTKWKTALDKASGVKVKDDIDLLKKSIKRVEKKKDKAKKEWTDRVQKVEAFKQKAQEKRTKNIEVRKEKKREKKVKRLKKKGRLLPGF